MINLFIGMMVFSACILLITVILVIVGIFSEDETVKAKYYAVSAKMTLLYAFVFMAGFGICFLG